jgi:hypothetical protein
MSPKFVAAELRGHFSLPAERTAGERNVPLAERAFLCENSGSLLSFRSTCQPLRRQTINARRVPIGRGIAHPGRESEIC